MEGRRGPLPLLRVQFPASRRKTLFGETSNTRREDAYAPQTPRRSPHAVKGVPPEAINTRSREIVSKAFI